MTETTDKKKLPAAVERFILHWGDMGDEWGVNRSVSQIHGLLYLAEAPMTAEDIAETLGMARSNVSNSHQGIAGLEPDPAGADPRRPPRSFRGRDRHLGSGGADRRRPQGTRDRPRGRCAARLRLRRGRRSDHQPGREQAAEGNAGFHRTGRPLVHADARTCRGRGWSR